MAKPRLIESRQRYREVGSGYLGRTPRVWVIEETFTKEADGLGYALLACEHDPSMRKTLSIAVLADRRRFSRVIEPS
jgi:hypothetical protein